MFKCEIFTIMYELVQNSRQKKEDIVFKSVANIKSANIVFKVCGTTRQENDSEGFAVMLDF